MDYIFLKINVSMGEAVCSSPLCVIKPHLGNPRSVVKRKMLLHLLPPTPREMRD